MRFGGKGIKPMRLLKDAVFFKLLDTLATFIHGSIKEGIKTHVKRILNHRMHTVVVEEKWGFYTDLSCYMWQNQKRQKESEWTGNKKSRNKSLESIKVKFKGATIYIKAEEYKPDKDEQAIGEKRTKSIRVSSYAPLEIIDEFLWDLFQSCNEGPVKRAYMYGFEKNEKKYLGEFTSSHVQAPILPKGVLKSVEDDLDKFYANKQFYFERGIPYHRGFCLYGEPGTGKSSIINYLAAKYGRYIYHISAASLTSGNIQNMVAGMGDYCFVAVEDIDCMYHGRVPTDTALPAFNDVLNAFDSITAPKGMVLFITTNVIEHLDKALVRPGRIDRMLNLTYCDGHQITEFIKRFYPGDTWDCFGPEFEGKFTPARIQELLIETSSAKEFYERLCHELSLLQ